MAKISFTFDDRRLRNNVEKLSSDMDSRAKAVLAYTATETVAYMKSNAPWTDRTGAARAGLTAIPSGGGGTYQITLAHAVHYGIWLEVKYGARDAVIMPSARVMGGVLMKRLAEAMMGG